MPWFCHSCVCKSQQFKDKMRQSMNQVDCKRRNSAASVAKWRNPAYRAKVSTACAAIWKSPVFREKMAILLASPEIKAKMSAANTAKWQNQKYKERMAAARATQIGHISSIQNTLYTYLDELKIDYYREGEQTCIGYYSFDCMVPNKNGKKLLIECQGDYWHSINTVQQNDRSKFGYINRYFPEYEIMYVWEHEFYCKDRVLDRLKLKLGVDIETHDFDFLDLQIKVVSFSEVKTFLDLYHYLGKDRGGKAYGVFLGDLLIAVMVFSPPLRQNTAGQFGLVDGEVRELSRLCIRPSYHKKNFASWFIKRVLRSMSCRLVIAYADTTVGHNGTIYRASNFKLHHIVPADYWYVDKRGYVMHKRTLYGHARSLKMTENEFAEAKGYQKKYGGEKLCFIKMLADKEMPQNRTDKICH
jgi:hypothetical protein